MSRFLRVVYYSSYIRAREFVVAENYMHKKGCSGEGMYEKEEKKCNVEMIQISIGFGGVELKLTRCF